MQVAYTLCWISALLVGVLLFIFSDYVGYVFTTNRVVVEEIAKIVPVLVIFEISDFTTNIGRGVVQGCGRQKFGALISFVSFYFIGLPVCIYLVLFRKWQAEGMWIGLCIAQSLQAIGLLFYTFSIDWDHEVHLSKERIGDQSEHTEAAKGNEEGISKVERMPLVNTNGFKLSRNVIYLRIMNTALATIICASGVIFYFLY
ncbi:protein DETOXIFICATION 2-like [Anneissia japonica]|uniref:protein DETOXIFICATION 2-like n=1 Tax=Anneissia japonica TaxID=1529436 RepID=UPI0014254ED3|nr:protein DETOXIFICATION 2-like [Anneissia japonica]